MEKKNEELAFNFFTSILGKPEVALADLDKFTYFEEEEDRDLIVTLLYKAYTEGIEFMNNKMEAQIQKWEEMQSENMRSE